MMYTRVLNRPEPEPAAGVPPAADTAAAEAAATGAPLDTAPGAADPATGTPAPASTPGTPTVAGGSGFKPGPGLPEKVVNAYDGGKVVVLLIVRGPGIDDQIVKRASESLRSRDDVALFVVKAVDISSYSRITRGVNVERTPALVVLQPKRLAEGGLPTATVAYGARAAASVSQQVRDALYSGRDNLPYYPE
jgi:hypothetical protein